MDSARRRNVINHAPTLSRQTERDKLCPESPENGHRVSPIFPTTVYNIYKVKTASRQTTGALRRGKYSKKLFSGLIICRVTLQTY